MKTCQQEEHFDLEVTPEGNLVAGLPAEAHVSCCRAKTYVEMWNILLKSLANNVIISTSVWQDFGLVFRKR